MIEQSASSSLTSIALGSALLRLFALNWAACLSLVVSCADKFAYSPVKTGRVEFSSAPITAAGSLQSPILGYL